MIIMLFLFLLVLLLVLFRMMNIVYGWRKDIQVGVWNGDIHGLRVGSRRESTFSVSCALLPLRVRELLAPGAGDRILCTLGEEIRWNGAHRLEMLSTVRFAGLKFASALSCTVQWRCEERRGGVHSIRARSEVLQEEEEDMSDRHCQVEIIPRTAFTAHLFGIGGVWRERH